MIAEWTEIAKIKPGNRSGMYNGGWAYDAYPELETLEAHRTTTIAEIKGPAVITCFHVTQQHFHDRDPITQKLFIGTDPVIPRGVILEIFFNDVACPAVRVPLSDFFADGCNGNADCFTSHFVEKVPKSYNCFIPMPFKKSARVVLRNETDFNLRSYSFVEFEQLSEWDDSLGIFHATWSRFAIQLTGSTNFPFFHVDGAGHLLGRSWSISTDEPFFKYFYFIMEANNEIRIDGEERPRLDYLGTEDSFGFSWGFGENYTGLFNGINHVSHDSPSTLSIYRFYGANMIRFNKSFDLRVDWEHEWDGATGEERKDFMKKIAQVNTDNGGWVDYATTYYWYQREVGYNHAPMLSVAERSKAVLSPGTNALTTSTSMRRDIL